MYGRVFLTYVNVAASSARQAGTCKSAIFFGKHSAGSAARCALSTIRDAITSECYNGNDPHATRGFATKHSASNHAWPVTSSW